MTALAINFLTMSDNPAQQFAEWMAKRRSDLKITLDQLEIRTGIKKQHLSTLERAAPHSLTGKAVVPKRPTVEKIAEGLEADTEEALNAAGYASMSQRTPDEALVAFLNLSGLDPDRRDEMYRSIRRQMAAMKAERDAEEGGQNE